MDKKFDFSGYATKVNLQCSDGRTIRKDAFKHNDGQTVPLVWQHMHGEPMNILGYGVLEHREDGTYVYCSFNDTDTGKNAKLLVEHGDITCLSIHANQLKEEGGNVLHGQIREVSLVLAGANPGARIDNLCFSHNDGDSYEEDTSEAIIYTDLPFSLEHKEDASKADDETTIQEVFDTMNEDQKNVCYAMIASALGEDYDEEEQTDEDEATEEGNTNKKIEHSNMRGDNEMKKNIFDKEAAPKETSLSHAEVAAVFADVKRFGSLKDCALSHGITNIDYLFPDATLVGGTPQFVSRDMGWVKQVMNAIHHTPFSRIKSILADITEADARAKGYIKGNLKVDEVFSLLKRTTSPTTIYKKQKLDRDDVVDITDFDVVAWLKSEMRTMLDEEIARAILVGDGRLSSSDDKVKEDSIRPIWTDEALYSVKASFDVTGATTADEKAKAFIKATIKARKNYKGSGEPSLYMSEDMLTDCLLLEDTTGRLIYDAITKLATVLRVKEIITVPVMDALTRVVGTDNLALCGIVVNLVDYNIGADKGGAVNMFDDFDIDYNAQKYLIETRASGALIKPFSALVIEAKSPVAAG